MAVLLPLPLACPYDYSLQTTQTTPPGTFVKVPLRGRVETGVVWHPAYGRKVGRLRSVLTVLDMPSLPAVVMRFIDWVAAYTLAPPGTVLRMVMNVPVAIGNSSSIDSSFVNSTYGCRLKDVHIEKLKVSSPISQTASHTALSQTQKSAADSLIAAVRAERFSITLLEGVMGSGKTEVYCEAVAEALRSGRQVLVMLPEIAFTTQWLDRFTSRFGLASAAWHSELTLTVRRFLWRAIAAGQIQLVVGTRSALFLPYPNLGLIIVDEEHELAFKQEGGVLYHARDMAVVRGQLGEHAVILTSATPSLETRVNVWIRRYDLIQLSLQYRDTLMPRISAIDMRRMRPEYGVWGQSWLAPPLVEEIRQTLMAGEQVMLFLNRRGYAPLTLCRTCGFRFRCPHCTAWLVEHRHLQGLSCHHCGYVTDLPNQCPHCGSFGRFAVCGPGVERIAEEVAKRFPAARLALLTSDHLKNGPAATTTLLQQIATGSIDMVIGTQIITKGPPHFPRLTLVGIVDADLGLAGGDLRAAERTFQLLSRVAGVVGVGGQGGRHGRVLVQTYDPLHPVMDALLSGTRERFYAAEAAQRRDAGMPPFGQLVALIVSGLNGSEVGIVAAELAHHKPCGPDITVLGPVPAPLAFLRDRHRHRLLLKASRKTRVQPLIRLWLDKIKIPRGIKVKVDINPYNFL